MSKTYQRHLAAIEGDKITKSNIIGLRKAINADNRKLRNLSVSRVAPNVSHKQMLMLLTEINKRQPLVVGELHDSGVKLLRKPRYAKRFKGKARRVVDTLKEFRLVGFMQVHHPYSCTNVVPMFRAVGAKGESFVFHNTAWQSGGNGPEIVS